IVSVGHFVVFAPQAGSMLKINGCYSRDMDLQTRNFETIVWMQMEMKLFYCVGIPKMVFQNNGIIRKEEAATMLHAVAFISIMTGDEFRVGIGDHFYFR